MVEVAVEARVRPTVDLVMETAREEMVVVEEAMKVQAARMVATVTGLVQDPAIKALWRWEAQLTALTWEYWSFN